MRRSVSIALAAVLAACAAWLAAASAGHSLAGAPRCPLFPASNPWNERVDSLPVARDSGAIVASIGLDRPLHADFGSGLYQGMPIGIPYTTVSARQRKVHVRFRYAAESDHVAYPIPRNAPIEGGRHSTGDRHVIVVDRSSCRLYELSGAYPARGVRSWRAAAGAVWNLRSNRVRPPFWTSADAAGLPILPGLARYDEVRAGAIDHALRFTVERTRRAFIFPARHYASSLRDPSLPAMGERLRLKASFDESGFPPQAQVVLTALKHYGMIVADNGSDWFISGAPSPQWSNDQLHSLARVSGRDFEVVDTGEPVTTG